METKAQSNIHRAETEAEVRIDDLVALQVFHGTGLGTLLLRHLQAEVRQTGCAAVYLDTGYQRHLGHRAHLHNGFHIDRHHMAWSVDHV